MLSKILFFLNLPLNICKWKFCTSVNYRTIFIKNLMIIKKKYNLNSKKRSNFFIALYVKWPKIMFIYLPWLKTLKYSTIFCVKPLFFIVTRKTRPCLTGFRQNYRLFYVILGHILSLFMILLALSLQLYFFRSHS